MPETVKVTLRAFFEDGKPFSGLLRIRLIRNAVDDHGFIAPRHWMEIPLVQEETAFSLMPSARLGRESYYVYQIVSRGFGAERIVQKGIVMVPEHDCYFADLITIEPSADEPEWAAQKAAAEARAWAETAEGCADRSCACARDSCACAEEAHAYAGQCADYAASSFAYSEAAGESRALAEKEKEGAAGFAAQAEEAYRQLYDKEEGLYARMRQIEEYLLELTDGDCKRY